MFVSKDFEFNDRSAQIDFMRQYPFASIITDKNGIPIATQLPFIVEEREDKLLLCGHFSAANNQINHIEKQTSLVLFSEPHAYISPTHYDKVQSVPTWDYISVHVYGRAHIIDNPALKINALEKMIQVYEPEYLEQWNSLSDLFIQAMLRGIVAFEIEVTDIQAQKKLSQNKTKIERERIIGTLKKSSNSSEQDLAKYIKNL